MRDIKTISIPICKNMRGIFCDIDDTITLEGKLCLESYRALWEAYEAGLKVVPITGRPAGWVDHIARMWPVTGVIGENGAFYFWMENGKMNRYFIQDKALREKNRQKLQQIRSRVLSEVPKSAVSADQNYRELDLAIDFCEDIPPLMKLL